MRKWWAEFKAIAIGGNVLDMALGFIIGTAFAAVLQSFVTNVFLQLIALFVGKRDFKDIKFTVEGTEFQVGILLTDVLNFMLLAVALFFVVKFLHWMGIERGRAFVQQNCPYCFDRVPNGAFICRSCGQQLVEELPDLLEARRMLAQREARKWPTIPPIPVRRRAVKEEEEASDEATEEA